MTRDELKANHPNRALSVNWEVDENFRWDGDGPDPIEDGFYPHDVTVTVSQIEHGQLYQGKAYLGGSYSPLNGPHCPDVHGYLPQMIDEALEDLAFALKQS